MGENTKIEWAHHTFNPWIGCSKVSPGCANCYAEDLMARRYKRVQWGPNGTRSKTGAATWNEPLRWDKAAAAAGERHRVFCASLADVFEDRDELVPLRAELFDLIRRTPNLDWLLLTKRPENILPAIEAVCIREACLAENEAACKFAGDWVFMNKPPANVWLGTSVENQEAADLRIPHLAKVPAVVRFLSCEPLLGPVSFRPHCTIAETVQHAQRGTLDQLTQLSLLSGIDWVIVGGESGSGARPMHPDWARGIRNQCQAAGVAFLFKQWGEYVKPEHMTADCYSRVDASVNLASGHYHDTFRVGKHAAGRILDGQEWLEFPEAVPAP